MFSLFSVFFVCASISNSSVGCAGIDYCCNCITVKMYSRICQKDWIKRFAYYQLAAFIVAVVETLIIYVLLSIFSLVLSSMKKQLL